VLGLDKVLEVWYILKQEKNMFLLDGEPAFFFGQRPKFVRKTDNMVPSNLAEVVKEQEWAASLDYSRIVGYRVSDGSPVTVRDVRKKDDAILRSLVREYETSQSPENF